MLYDKMYDQNCLANRQNAGRYNGKHLCKQELEGVVKEPTKTDEFLIGSMQEDAKFVFALLVVHKLQIERPPGDNAGAPRQEILADDSL